MVILEGSFNMRLYSCTWHCLSVNI